MPFIYPDGSDHAAKPKAVAAIVMHCALCGKPIFGTAHLDLFVHTHKAIPSKRRASLCAVCGLVRSSIGHHD